MTAIVGFFKEIAILALAAGVIAGLVAAWYALTAGQFLLFIVCCFAGLLVVFTAIILSAGFPYGRGSDDDTDEDAEAHMKPLRQPGVAEKNLETDLRQRRMLLRPRGLTEARAAQLNRQALRRTLRDRIGREAPQQGRHAAQARTETIPVVPAGPERHEPTEVIPVLAGPVPLFADVYPLTDTGVMKAYGSEDA